MTVKAAGWLLTFPTLATMVTVPGETPVTNPVLSIVAIGAKLQNQAIGAVVIGLPEESTAVAVNCFVPPTATLVDIGEIVTVATRCVTVSVAVLLVIPEAAAVIVAVPLARPVATPVLSTDAIVGALLVQV